MENQQAGAGQDGRTSLSHAKHEAQTVTTRKTHFFLLFVVETAAHDTKKGPSACMYLWSLSPTTDMFCDKTEITEITEITVHTVISSRSRKSSFDETFASRR